MKHKWIIGLSLALFIINFSGCVLYQGQRPTDYQNTLWKSDDPDVWFNVGERDEKGYLEEPLLGKAVIGEETVDIYVGFGTDRYIGFSVDEFDEFGNRITVFMGDCQFYEDRCVVTPREGKDQLFNGEYDTITFTRIDLESTST